MTTFIFANNINTTLAGSISSSTLTMTLSSTANLPASVPVGTVLVLTLNDAATESNFEIVYVTAIAGATVTMTRAQEGTAAQAWTTGDFVYSGPTAGQMANFSQGGSSGVTPGSYGDSTHVAQFTVNATGQITAASSVAIAFPITSFNGRAGAIVLNSSDVTTALGYTPVNKAGDTVTGTLILNNANAGALQISQGTSASSSIYLSNNVSGGHNWEVASAGGSIAQAGFFYIRDQTTGLNQLVIDTGGNVHLAAAIAVAGNISAQGGSFVSSGSEMDLAMGFGGSTNNGFYLSVNSSSFGINWNNGSGGYGGTAISIDHSGNVTINGNVTVNGTFNIVH
ncbi:hypothetical protein [Dyella sp.]|uniref:hypothetical protein n=1 Tax=Dyella sp. TaxID=1869338 RepID=UPI002845B663|nr:hypothetical protein [Dyella sp.]MDR3445991.1 hypothetical protein [Dyella sp.]